ncbi:MAG TPA: DUF4294 domain-containing protein [Flavobacteriaceae bacterium]|nr:DUF4294 domain-containing protein [Flavobacteriaceae bacterium]
MRRPTFVKDSLKTGFLQIDSIAKDSVPVQYIVMGDSIPVDAIDLDKVVVLGKLKFKNPQEQRRYLILQRKTRKVWPFATLAAARLKELNRRLEKIEDKSDRKQYIRMIQNYMEGKFKEKLKNLTKTEGQILVKLLYRQTGITTYELVREMRSGWNAFWYNSTAGLFNISLKEKYLPESVEEDFLIEDILQRSFRSGVLDSQEPAIEIDYLELLNKWR